MAQHPIQPFSNITNVVGAGSRKYDPHVSLDGIYAPLVKKGMHLQVHCSPTKFAAKRAQGCVNIDLWLNGSIYHRDPQAGVAPPFRNLKSFLEFCCHGESGLHGYTKALSQIGRAEVVALEEHVHKLQEAAIQSQAEYQRWKAESIAAHVQEIKDLAVTNGRQVAEVEANHREKLSTVENELQSMKGTVHFLQKKLATAARARSIAAARATERRGLESLAANSGNTKKRVL
jgi:hypothetical protein